MVFGHRLIEGWQSAAAFIQLQQEHSKERTAAQCGRSYRVLVEGPSKKNAEEFQGRNTYNTMIVFPKGDVEPGQYHYVRTTDHTSITLRGELVDEAEAQEEGFIA